MESSRNEEYTIWIDYDGMDDEDVQEMIEEMLRRGKRPEEIVDFCGYPIELVRTVEKKISGTK